METKELLNKGLETFDDVHYSRGEEEADRTARHLTDMNSDSKFAKIGRPLWTTIICVVWSIREIVDLFIEKEINNATATSILTIVLSFYFVIRGYEKVQARKAAAAIHQEKLKTKHELREDKRDSRAERKEERRK